MSKEYKDWFLDIFKNANKEQIQTVGTAAFGSIISYLKSDRKDIIDSFKKDYGIGQETYTDRLIFKYVTKNIEDYEKFSLEKPTLEEAIEKIQNIINTN